MTRKPQGELIIIGGHEREGELAILKEVVKVANRKSGPILIVTVATQSPEEMAKEYVCTSSKHLGQKGDFSKRYKPQ